jgi:hypothetical protein
MRARMYFAKNHWAPDKPEINVSLDFISVEFGFDKLFTERDGTTMSRFKEALSMVGPFPEIVTDAWTLWSSVSGAETHVTLWYSLRDDLVEERSTSAFKEDHLIKYLKERNLLP